MDVATDTSFRTIEVALAFNNGQMNILRKLMTKD